MIQDGCTRLKTAELLGCSIPAVNKTANGGLCNFTGSSLLSQRHTVSATRMEAISFVPTTKARTSLRQFARNSGMSNIIMCRSLTPNFTQIRQDTWTVRTEILLRPKVHYCFHCDGIHVLHCLIIGKETIPLVQERVTAAHTLTSSITQI